MLVVVSKTIISKYLIGEMAVGGELDNSSHKEQRQ